MAFAKTGDTNELIRNYIMRSFIQKLPNVKFEAPQTEVFEIFSTLDLVTSTGTVYSNDCWGSSYNLDGISFSIDGDTNTRGGVLISPVHIYYSKHSAHSVGATPIFFAQGSSLQSSGTIDGIYTSAGSDPTDDDFALAHLDAAIPAGSYHMMPQMYYKVLPENYSNYFSLDELPCIIVNQDAQVVPFVVSLDGAREVDTAIFANSSIAWSAPEFLASSPRAYRVFAMQNAEIRSGGITKAYELKTGDSSYPIFLPIGDELVLLGTLTDLGGDGAFITGNFTEVEQLMASGGESTYTSLSTYDLEGLVNRLTSFGEI